MTKVIGNYDDRDVSLIAKDQYFRQVHWSAPLSQEELTLLLERVQRGRGADGSLSADALAARDRVVEGCQPLVIHIAAQMLRQCRVLERLDLIQEGSIGLMHAIERYDAAVVCAVSSWFGVCIHDAMAQAIIEQDSVVRLTGAARTEMNLLRRAEAHLGEVLHRLPTVAEVAAHLQVSERKVLEWRAWRHWKEVESIQGLLEEDEEEDRHDFISLFQASVDEAGWRSERVREAVASALTERQQEVIRRRFGMHEEDGRQQTQAEVAAGLGMADYTVRNAEQAAYHRLHPLLAVTCEIAGGLERATFVCGKCGREFPQRFGQQERWSHRDEKYCSDKCRGAARREQAGQTQEVA